MAHWSDDLIGLPWKEKGRGREGTDCWGLVRLAFAEKRKIGLPSYHDAYASTLDCEAIEHTIDHEMAGLVERVEPADVLPWDFVLMREGDQAVHVGLVTTPGRMLHIERGQTSGVVRLADAEFRLRIVGFFRLTGVLDA